MKRQVEVKFTKNWGSYKKGDSKVLNMQLARSLQDVRKVGKIVKPKEDKVEPKFKARATK